MQKVEEVMAIFDTMLQELTRLTKEAQTFAQGIVGVLIVVSQSRRLEL